MEVTSALLRLWRPPERGLVDPKSDILESLFEGDGVSCSPKPERGLPTISRVVLGGVVGVLLTRMDGISARMEWVQLNFSRRRKKR